MDPNTALKDILDDLSRADREGHRAEILENLGTLADWIYKGGFLPKVMKWQGGYRLIKNRRQG